jgi:hypothetical protein
MAGKRLKNESDVDRDEAQALTVGYAEETGAERRAEQA